MSHIGLNEETAALDARAAGGETVVRMPLHRLAHSRAGDKGNRQNISLIAYRPEHWPLLLSEVRDERVLALFRHRGATRCVRYELANLMALNFVIDDALEGGVNAALALDTHGKTSAFRLLAMEIDVPVSLATTALPAPASGQSATEQKQGGI